MTDETEVRSQRGKEILAHAMDGEHTVLEFKERSDGSMVVLDVTEHFEQMEEKLNE